MTASIDRPGTPGSGHPGPPGDGRRPGRPGGGGIRARESGVGPGTSGTGSTDDPFGIGTGGFGIGSTASAPNTGPGITVSPGSPGPVGFNRQLAREVLHLLLNLPLVVLGFVYVVCLMSLGIGLAVTVIGLPLLAAGLAGARLFGRLERSRARALLALRVEEPSPLPGRRGRGVLPWLWTALADPVAWRTMLYAFIRLPWGVPAFVLTLVGLILPWPALPHLARGLSNVDRAMVRGLLSPSDGLERRIAELESDRGVVVDTAAADLRRIERDLHDGAQARLVNLAMGLGLAKEKLLSDPEAAARMVDEAHGEVKTALQELRDLARGIHPAVLTDRGLDAALSSLATRCTVPVTITVDLDERPAPAIEGIAYFTLSELLQNISKHSGATTAAIDIWRTEDRLLLQVTDNGRGGIAVSPGGGLAGLAERLDAVDGLFVLESPAGGPTTVTAELPWRHRPAGPTG